MRKKRGFGKRGGQFWQLDGATMCQYIEPLDFPKLWALMSTATENGFQITDIGVQLFHSF
jgi:hypothetical protein